MVQSDSGPDPIAKRLRESFETKARAAEPSLLRTALRLTRRDQDWSKDLVQETLISGYRAFLEGGFQEGTNAKAWLVKILTNRFLNDYRRRKKWESESDLPESDSDARLSDSASPEKSLMEATLDEPLELALGALPEGQRLCVMLVDIDGLDYAEAAELLEVPIGTVRSRLARARLQLYELLTPYAKERGLITP